MRLDELLDEVSKAMPLKADITDKHAAVEGITDNTSEVREGYIFVCVKGARFDGHDFAKKAMEQGAKTLADIKRMTGACCSCKCAELNPSGKCCAQDIALVMREYLLSKK